MEVDLNAFEHNVSEIKKYINEHTVNAEKPKIMPVVKANGYGTHINFKSDFLNQFDIVAVALANEGAVLRENGYKNEIFVLNQPCESEIDTLLDNNITIGVSDEGFVELLGQAVEKSNKNVKVHIEIDTGMGRTGIKPENIIDFISKIKCFSNIEIEGIYTHLSSADYDEEYTKEQLDKFKKAVDNAELNIGKLKYFHCSASNGILNFLDYLPCNLVRAGIVLYGYESFEGMYSKIDLKPVCKLRSRITFLKEVDEGTSISYSRRFITNRKTKVATIPIGYADGLRRELTNKGEVIINGQKAPIIGSVCMDSFMADVTDIPNVSAGDYAYIWDNEKITLEEVAQKCGTINYEIMSTISDRVERLYI